MTTSRPPTRIPCLLLGLAFAAAAAGAGEAASAGVPEFNVKSSCRTGIEQGVRKDVQKCLDSEQNARDLLVKQWNEFSQADRTLCTQASSIGGSPTYTELITCLEMRRDAKALKPTPGNGIAKR